MLLKHIRVLYRNSANGGTLFCPISSQDPDTLFIPIGDDNICMRFVLRLKNPYFLNFTDVSIQNIKNQAYYFDNLTDLEADSTLYLGDSIIGSPLTNTVTVIHGHSYTFEFDSAVASATIQLTDVFGNSQSIDFSNDVPVDSYSLDLQGFDNVTTGRYVLSDEHGNTHHIYFAPELVGGSIFGLIDIYTRTEAFSPTDTNEVPTNYRFINDDDELILSKENRVFAISFDNRPVYWRYIIQKQYDANPIEIEDLTMDDVEGVSFSHTDEGDKRIFTSDTKIALTQTPKTVTLNADLVKLMDLPNPTQTTVLQKDDLESNDFYAEMHIMI